MLLGLGIQLRRFWSPKGLTRIRFHLGTDDLRFGEDRSPGSGRDSGFALRSASDYVARPVRAEPNCSTRRTSRVSGQSFRICRRIPVATLSTPTARIDL